jgi:hypothetical protein
MKKKKHASLSVAILVCVSVLALGIELSLSNQGEASYQTYVGTEGELASMPLFYTSSDVPRYDNLEPLVAYVDIGGTPIEWNYHGILMYNRYIYNDQVNNPANGDVCGKFYKGLFGYEGYVTIVGLDILDEVVGDLKTKFSDWDYRFNVVISICWSTNYPEWSDPINSVNYVYAKWDELSQLGHYQHLSLAGFYWGHSETPFYPTQIRDTADCIHGLHPGCPTIPLDTLKFYAAPYYPMWPPTTTDWHSLGVDYVMGQPNYMLDGNPTRFQGVNDAIEAGYLDGVIMEPSKPPAGHTIAENANAYLDAAFKYRWMKNEVNGFYFAPGYLNLYATGGYLIDVIIPEYNRPIYDRLHQFVRNFETVETSLLADTHVMSYFPGENYGSDTRLLLGTNQILPNGNQMRFYTKFDIGQIPWYSFIAEATLELELIDFVYGHEIDDGEIYKVPSTWTEMGLTWDTQPTPGPLLESGIVFTDTVFHYEIDVTNGVQIAIDEKEQDISLMVRRAVESFEEKECKFYSKEGSVLLAPKLTVEYVLPQWVRLPVTEDSYVREAAPDTNYGYNIQLFHGTLHTDTNQYALRPYLKYQLNGFPDSSLLHHGDIALYLYQFYYGHEIVYYGQEIADGVLYFVSDDSWNEVDPNGIDWNNQPIQSTWNLRYENLYFSHSHPSYNFDVLDDIKTEHEGDDEASFMLKRQFEDGQLRECGFWSSEYEDNLGQRAQLWVLMQAYDHSLS